MPWLYGVTELLWSLAIVFSCVESHGVCFHVCEVCEFEGGWGWGEIMPIWPVQPLQCLCVPRPDADADILLVFSVRFLEGLGPVCVIVPSENSLACPVSHC